jgi:hypothetical protein
MKIFTHSVLVALLLIIAAPAYSARAVQVFVCEFHDDTTEEQVLEMTAAWLKAAKGVAGGKNMEAYVRFPVAEGPQSEGDYVFSIAVPSFAEWGEFTDAYEGSAASKVDDDFDNLVDCGDSTMWEATKIQ